MKNIFVALLVLGLTGCSFLYYGSEERAFVVIDLHPAGESLSFSGELDDLASVEVNREQGSSDEVIGDVIDGVTGVPGLPGF